MRTSSFRAQCIRSIAILCLLISLMSINAFSVHAVAPVVRYVSASGGDAGDCSLSSSPCATIQYAVNRSRSGDTILVAAGTYTSASPADCAGLQVNPVVCILDKRLSILGGYTTSNWTTSDPAHNVTIIDGSNSYRGVALIGDSIPDAYANVEGFTIRNGRSHGLSARGAGMLVVSGSVILRSITFENNQVNGSDNGSGDGGQADGAALSIQAAPSGTTSIIQHVVFSNNRSYGGSGSTRGGLAFGAFLIYQSSVTIEDATFTNNLAQAGSSAGGGISPVNGLNADALGGALAIQNCRDGSPDCANKVITLNRVTMTGNQVKGGNAGVNGGGAYGGSIIVEDVSLFSINDSLIANNVATAGNGTVPGYAGGGGVQSQNTAEVTIQQTTILGNTVTGGSTTNGGASGAAGGGGLFLFTTAAISRHATLTNVIIAENLVQQGSGTKSATKGIGAGIALGGINADITHVSLARNRFDPYITLGSALMVQPLNSGFHNSVNLNYSIIADHTEGGANVIALLVGSGTTMTLNKGMFSGNTKDSNNGTPGAGTFVNYSSMQSAASAGFVSPGSPAHDYHILSSSFAKDKAVGSTTPVDIDSQPRPFGPASDYGADEFVTPSLSAVPNNIFVLVDANNQITRSSRIDVNMGTPVSWTASTSAAWIYLGVSGTSGTAAGQSGTDLAVRLIPANLGLGTYNGTITITSPSALQTTITVRLLKVSHLERVYIPLIMR